jgi:cation diffusion facilitator CzcD-associated flavoprotein CzcO
VEAHPSLHSCYKRSSAHRRPRGDYVRPGGLVEEWSCDAIAIRSGLHVIPDIPHIKGIEHVPIIMHPSEYKLKSQFGINEIVLILGTGETGMDISLFAVKSTTKSVMLCHRDGFMCMPKVSFLLSSRCNLKLNLILRDISES